MKAWSPSAGNGTGAKLGAQIPRAREAVALAGRSRVQHGGGPSPPRLCLCMHALCTRMRRADAATTHRGRAVLWSYG